MFKQLFDVLQKGERANIIVTRNENDFTVTIVPIYSKENTADRPPVTATGAPEELDEKLIPAYGQTHAQVREMVISTEEILKAVKEKEDEAKKKADEKKATKAGKTSPAKPVATKSAETTDDNDEEENDGEDESSKDDASNDVPAAKPAKQKEASAAPAAPKEPKAPELTAEQKKQLEAQQKSIEEAKALLVKAETSADDDLMANYYRKKAVAALALSGAEAPEVMAGFDALIAKLAEPQSA